MVGLYLNPDMAVPLRRERVFEGDILLYVGQPEAIALARHAADLIGQAYAPYDPETIQFNIDVMEFIARTGPLKSKFTNDLRTKELMRALLLAMGCDPKRTYFDVPRLRIVPHGGYLSAGVSYAYKAHRDIWYSSPTAQINYWMPVFAIVPGRAMSFYPEYWERPIANSSAEFDYQDWCAVGRQQAAQQVKEDARRHPLPLETVSTASDLRIAGNPGDLMLFSASHLHATHPNNSGVIRFSIDFRTVDLDDVQSSHGAPNIDSRATGTTLGDFINMNDFSPLDASSMRTPSPRGKRANVG